jgi:hypothetical protein
MMFGMRSVRRRWRLAALGAVLGVHARPGLADAQKDKWEAGVRFCSNVYNNAVELEQAGKLRQARAMLLSGAKAQCIAPVRQQCIKRYTQLESEIPSVVPIVTSEDGEPRVDVQVTIDNELVTNRLDGRALPLDPGLHEFTFSTEGKVIATEKIMIVQGQRNRPISIAMRAADASAKKAASDPGLPELDAKASSERAPVYKQEPERGERPAPLPEKPVPEKPKPEKAKPETNNFEQGVSDAPSSFKRQPPRPGPMPYLFGTIGVAGLGGAVLLTYWGRKDNDLLAKCAPNCSQSSVDHIHRLYVASDVSLGIGVAALATSVVWFLTSQPSKDKSQAKTSYRLDVQPTRSGGVAAVSGSF